jgi:SAM-dependent methyltransferase
MFNPIIKAAGWERAAQVRLELACIMKMVLDPDPAPFQDINAEIDKWLSASGDHSRFRALDVMSNPRVKSGSRVVEFCVFGGPESGRVFRLTINCSSMEDLYEYPGKVTLEVLDAEKEHEKGHIDSSSYDDPVVRKVRNILGSDLTGRRILELGIGGSTDRVRELAAAGASVTAVDIEDEVIKAARRSLEDAGAVGIELKVIEFNKPFVFADGEFDAIVFSNILDFVFAGGTVVPRTEEGAAELATVVANEWEKFFRECRRVLGSGGIIAAEDVADPEYSIKNPRLARIAKEFYEKADIAKAAERAGLTTISQHQSSVPGVMVFGKSAEAGEKQTGSHSEPKPVARRMPFEDTGRLMVNTVLDRLLGEKLASQVQLIEKRPGEIFLNRRPSLARDAAGEFENDIMGRIWDGITVKPELALSRELLTVVQKTYYLAALYKCRAKESPDLAEKAILLASAEKTMQDATDELVARGVKQPVRHPAPAIDHLVIRRNLDLLRILVEKKKKDKEKTVVITAGMDLPDFGITVAIDSTGKIAETGTRSEPLISFTLSVNPLDGTLEGLPARVHANLVKAVDQYNDAKKISGSRGRGQENVKRDDRPTMKIDPATGNGQIGKRVLLLDIKNVGSDDVLHGWKAARVSDQIGEINYLLLDIKGTSYFDRMSKSIANAPDVEDAHKTILLSMLGLIEDSPPEMAVFDDYIDDFFGFARPEEGQCGMIGLYKGFAEDPIAQLHEILEHLAGSGRVHFKFAAPLALVLKRTGLGGIAARMGLMRGEIVMTDVGGREFGKVALKGEALSIVLKNPAILHNRIRALQRQVFGDADRVVTSKIKISQIPRVDRQNGTPKVWEKMPLKGVVPMSDGFGGRLFTIGDIHGDLVALRETLEGLGLIKRGIHGDGMDDIWTGETAIVVQGGDAIDRGDKSIEVLLYLRRLQTEADAHHGKVVRLIGNHELYYLLRYDKGRLKGLVEQFKNKGYLRGFDEDLWADDKELLKILREDIRHGRLIGAYQLGGKVFTHAAVSPEALEYLGVESGEDVTLPKTFCAVVNKTLRSSAKASMFDSVIFATGEMAGWRFSGIFSEYSIEMVLKCLGYQPFVVQSLSYMSAVKILKKEMGDGSGEVDKFAFDEVVFHDPRLFMGLMDIGVIRGKKTQKSLVCADVGMGACFGSGRASVLFEGGGVYKVLPKVVFEDEAAEEYLHSLPDFKVSFITGALSEAGLNKLREGTGFDWLKNLAALSRADGRITKFDICMLPILERVPSVFFSGDDWGIYEFTEDGIGYGTDETGEFVRFTKHGKRLIGELLGNEEEEFFSGEIDYLSKVKIIIPEFPGKMATSVKLLDRGTDMVLKAVAEGHVRPNAFVSQSELQDPDGHMAYDSLCLRVVIGLLDHMPGVFTVDTKREDWYWAPKRNAVKFVNRVTGKTETVKYSAEPGVSGFAEAAKVKAVLSLIRRSVANKAMNFLDGLALDARGTANDRLRYELLRDFMESVPLAYDHLLIFESISSGENVDAGRIMMSRFIPRELRLMYAAQAAFPERLGDYARAQSIKYRPDTAMFRTVVYGGKDGERYRNPSLIIPPHSLYKRECLDVFVAGDEIKAYLATLDKGYIGELAYVFDLVRGRARLFYDSTSEDYLKMYAGLSWETGSWDGYNAARKQTEAELVPNDHFLFVRIPELDSSEEDFVEHVAAYVLFGPQFRKAAERSVTLASKYDFIKNEIFMGTEYVRNYDFREAAFGAPSRGAGQNTAGPSSEKESAPDLAGQDVRHSQRNKALAALIKADSVYRVGNHKIALERFVKAEALTFAGSVLDLLSGVRTRWRALLGRIALKYTVQNRLLRIRKGGLIDKTAYDGSLDVAALAEALGVSEDNIRQGLASVAFALDVLIVKDRLSLYDGGPIGHMRRGVTQGQGGAAIWLGEKLFTLKDVKDEDIARLMVEEGLHFLYPDAGHDVIKHSEGLSTRLTQISRKIGEEPGVDSCEADMSFGPSLSQGMALSQELVPQQRMLLETVLEQIQELEENEPEPEKARKGLEGLVEADRILKECGAIGIVVGSISAALYGADTTVSVLSGHSDVDVAVLTPGFEIREPFEGGIDWWLPVKLSPQHMIEDAGGRRVETIFVNANDCFIRAGMKLNTSYMDVQEMKPGLYLPKKSFLVDITRAVAMASIDSRVEVDDDVITSLTDKIDNAIGEKAAPLWAKTFGADKVMHEEFVEISDFSLNTVQKIQDLTKYRDTGRKKELSGEKDRGAKTKSDERIQRSGEDLRARYDISSGQTGINGINLIDVIGKTLNEQFGGKRSYIIIPFGSAVYLRDRTNRIAWDYLDDIDVQVLFFEDMAIAARRKAGKGGGLVAEFHKCLAANLKEVGADPAFSEKVDISFEDEIIDKNVFNVYFDDVMPYMVEAFGETKTLKIFRDYIAQYLMDINLYGRYEDLWAALPDEGPMLKKTFKRLAAMAAIRGDDEAVQALMTVLGSTGGDAPPILARFAVSPDDAGTKLFFKERIPAYGSQLLKNIDSILSSQKKIVSEGKKGRLKAADTERVVEQKLRMASIASRHLLRIIKEQPIFAQETDITTDRICPIDVLVDLTLIPEADVAENMETWAYLVLMCREMKNVNFIFEIPASAKRGEGPFVKSVMRDETNAASQNVVLNALADEIRGKAACLDIPGGVEEFIKSRVNVPRRNGSIEVAIMAKKRLQLLQNTGEGIPANQYPVALDGISSDASGKIALRHFESALTIGLAEAALVMAARRAEEGEEGVVSENDEFKKKVLEKLQKIYSIFREDVKLTGKTLDNMVSPYTEVRTNLAISLALPSMARMAYQKLLEFHNGLQLFLQAA